MSRVAINTGTTADDGTGSTLRVAGGIINDNFTEVYKFLGDGNDLTVGNWRTTAVGINTTKNVGIGTTNPRFSLEVGATGAAGTSLFVHGNARVTGILTVGTSSILLDGPQNQIRVGTGVTITSSAVIVDGTAFAGTYVTTIVAGSGIGIDTSIGSVTITATGGAGLWELTSTGIGTTASVGVGTTVPRSKLHVIGNALITGVATAPTFSILNSNALLSSGSVTDSLALNLGTFNPLHITPFSNNSNTLNNKAYSQISLKQTGDIILASQTSAADSDSYIRLYTPTSSSAIERLTISGGTGNVGIGSTQPNSLLTVGGDANFSGVVTATTFIGNLTGNVVGNVNSTGVSTFVSLNSTNINASGVTTSSGGFVGNLTGNVTGNVTGDITGNISGNVTGNLTGNVNSTGVSTFTTLGISGITTTQHLQVTGISTITSLSVSGVSTVGTALTVYGNARIVGILTVGTSSLTLNGTTNNINSDGDISFSNAGSTSFSVVSTGMTMASGKRLDLSAYSESVQTLGSSGSPISGTNALDVSTYSTFIAYVGSSSVTFTLTGAVSNRLSSWTLILIYTNAASRNVTFSFGTLRYAGGSSSVTLSSTQTRDILAFFTADAASNTYGSVVGLNFTT